MKILNKSNVLTSVESINRNLKKRRRRRRKKVEKIILNIWVKKCTQSSKSRKFFGSKIQGLAITESNLPTEYLLDALIPASLE